MQHRRAGWAPATMRARQPTGVSHSCSAAALVAVLACSPTPPHPTGNTAQPTSRDGVTSLGKALAAAQDMDLFLLFGQSNMEGLVEPEDEDNAVNARIYVLGYDARCHDRQWNQWALAAPPLHRCWAGVGPGDWFAKTLAQSWPSAKIGLVPAAISGAPISLYRKEVISEQRRMFDLPPSDGWGGAYEMMLARARVAQASGTIRGLLFHQGEADTANRQWLGQVAEVVADLRRDLNLPEQVPFLAGELVHDGCCHGVNALINQLPDMIPNAHVVSAAGLTAIDSHHFDLAGQRELGRRYAEVFLEASQN